ncbi:MAG: hypothetical protein OXU77_02965 [Gammaproteobacteria bacterium]|nr:hypothetical protein [Gammaproteobacteria bacterium]MDE0441211.1 hypothetical protein [Gammaproteobacteria bacterium]
MHPIAALADIFRRCDVPWAVVGAHAANFYRRDIRTTLDVDVLVSLGTKEMAVVADAMVAEGWRIKRTMPEGWLLRVEHPTHGPADIIAAGVEYQDIALARAQDRSFPGVIAKVLAVEDVLIHKLIANRAQDEADVLSILAANPDLDLEYLDHWIEFWEVADRYRHCQAETTSRGREDDEGDQS